MEALSFFPNASVKTEQCIKCTTFCPMLLSSEEKVLIGLVRPVVVSALQ